MGYVWFAAEGAEGSVRFRDTLVAEVNAIEEARIRIGGLDDIAYLTCSCSTDRLSMQLMRWEFAAQS